MSYFLQSPRLGFRRWTEDDLDLAFQLWGDAEVTRLIGGPFSREYAAARLAREMASDLQYWPIFLRETGEHVGCCGLRPHRPDLPALGFHLRPAYWGRGLGEEAARAVIDHAFHTLGITALFAGHHPQNTRSRALLEKLGFAYTGDELYPPTGLQHPSYVLQNL